jgi:hypothetical protein
MRQRARDDAYEAAHPELADQRRKRRENGQRANAEAMAKFGTVTPENAGEFVAGLEADSFKCQWEDYSPEEPIFEDPIELDEPDEDPITDLQELPETT